MLSAVSTGADLTTRIRELFAESPATEMQLLNIAAKARFSGRFRDLKRTVDGLVAEGELLLVHHGGGQYYRRKDEGQGTEGTKGTQGMESPTGP
ncbi:MAG: hypothetical protein EHM61_01670 [Acidobacteria bacterium]|nr:MAG: hypothetical protein EHM61_01670 [Acidobacteriota bacterium]